MLEATTAKMAEVFDRRSEDKDGLKVSREFVVGVATRKP
jgi:hypothetical protein